MHSIEIVWQAATKVSIYKHSVCALDLPKILDIGCPENLLVYHISAFEYQVLTKS